VLFSGVVVIAGTRASRPSFTTKREGAAQRSQIAVGRCDRILAPLMRDIRVDRCRVDCLGKGIADEIRPQPPERPLRVDGRAIAANRVIRDQSLQIAQPTEGSGVVAQNGSAVTEGRSTSGLPRAFARPAA
jgi:hypothetical protein